jgi:hypothetical protein
MLSPKRKPAPARGVTRRRGDRREDGKEQHNDAKVAKGVGPFDRANRSSVVPVLVHVPVHDVFVYVNVNRFAVNGYVGRRDEG